VCLQAEKPTRLKSGHRRRRLRGGLGAKLTGRGGNGADGNLQAGGKGAEASQDALVDSIHERLLKNTNNRTIWSGAAGGE